jgi:hypothetical protein
VWNTQEHDGKPEATARAPARPFPPMSKLPLGALRRQLVRGWKARHPRLRDQQLASFRFIVAEPSCAR